MSETLELPESVLRQLLEAAKATGATPVQWIEAHLPKGNGQPSVATEVELAAADARLDQQIIHLGRQTGLNNEQIDAELAQEFEATHELLSSGSGRR